MGYDETIGDRVGRLRARRELTQEGLAWRGLAVVAGYSAAWGADRVPWGKRVWADVDVSGDGS